MPQLNKGGKFVYGLSLIQNDYSLNIPPQAIEEYDIVSEGKVYINSGSKKTGGFVVSRKGLLLDSKIGNILKETTELCDYSLPEGQMVKYKGRFYCWLHISEKGSIKLTPEMVENFDVKAGDKLMSIRSSDIAFTMGAKGPLMEKAMANAEDLEVF